jgi:adenylosuccinate lyase
MLHTLANLVDGLVTYPEQMRRNLQMKVRDSSLFAPADAGYLVEKRTNHDVIAFLENVASSVGPAARPVEFPRADFVPACPA